MPKPTMRNGLILATALAVTAIGSFVTWENAYASYPGTGSQLTSSNGGTSIALSGKSALSIGETVTDAAWSPDGSRAVFVTDSGELDSVRYNNQNDTAIIADALPNGKRSNPAWALDGSALVWAEQAVASKPWAIEIAPSSPEWGYAPTSPNDGNDYTHPDAGPNGIVVAQRQADSSGTPTGQADAYKIGNKTATLIISDAASPSVSPDGTQLAFVRTDGTNNQIWTSGMDGSNPTMITSDSFGHDNPTWSPDGNTLAFTNTSSNAVYTHAANSSSGASTLASGVTGVPAYEPANQDHVTTLAGTNRYQTAVAISGQLWAKAGAAPDGQHMAAQSVVLSRSDTYADAVSGSALAAAKHGPLLMTSPTSLNTDTKAEIIRVLGNSTTAPVYLLGSPSAISTSVEAEIQALGYHTIRLAGADRYATSIAIANEINPDPRIILAATGRNFPDALGAGAAAGSYDAAGGTNAVVVLTNDTALPTATKTYLDTWYAAHHTSSGFSTNYQMFGVGNQGATALGNTYQDVFPLAGPDRYATAAQVAYEFFGGEQSVGLAIGTNWPDALAGGAFLAMINAPLYLTSTAATLNGDTTANLLQDSGSISTCYVFGAVVPAGAVTQAGTSISGPGGSAPSTPSSPAAVSMAARSAAAATPAVTTPTVTSTKHFTVAQLQARARQLLNRH